MKVLLAEDNLPMREFIKGALSTIPDASVVFETGKHVDAREWLKANPAGWDVAVVDLFLTEGNGFRILKDCIRRSPGQKVVVMTNYAGAQVEERVMAEGADAFFEKSSDFANLIQYLKQMAG
ncbi:MAG: response regulator [Pseudomonadota bacterium]